LNFPFNIYLTAFLSAGAVTALTLPCWRAWSRRAGLVDDPGHRKIHDSPIPLAGGLAVLSGVCIPVLLGVGLVFVELRGRSPSVTEADSLKPSQAAQPSVLAPVPSAKAQLLDSATAKLVAYGFGRRAVQLTAIVIGALGMVCLGLIDDRCELRPALKFGGQLLIAVLVAAAGVRVTLFVPNLVFSYLVTILWILTVTNALNFMDNMNGLCTGLGAIGAWCFALVAAAQGHYLVALLAFLTCGALLGFLPYNFPRASAFLGDSGSHLVGYLLAVLAILPHFYTPQRPRVLAVFAPLLILAVPLLDLAWVVVVRWRMGQPFYRGDTNHLSHRLVRRGLNPVQAVLLIWLLAAVAACLVLI
jgi:UDP-GlcNAc:undecaprenyl-phosphate/decaprenyl-phosphate GlcNAc-1-phosphate transferase